MVLDRILDTLADHSGDGAARVARMGFLEWACSLPDGANVRQHAQLARQRVRDLSDEGQALDHFEALLEQACLPLPATRRRRSAIDQRLH